MPLLEWLGQNFEIIAVCGAAVVGLKVYLLHEEAKAAMREDSRTERARIYAEARRAERAAEAGAYNSGFSAPQGEEGLGSLMGLLSNPQIMGLVGQFLGGKKGGGGAAIPPSFQESSPPSSP